MFSTTAIALAFVASTQANALFPNVDDKEDFNLDDACAKINVDDDDECLTSLVDLQLNQNNVDAETDAKISLQNDRREFDRQRLVAARGLEAAINALNANPNSRALIGWCQNEVNKIAKRERVGIDVSECAAICGQVRRGRDASEAFECVRDKLEEKGKENAEGEDFQSIVDIRDAQFNQQAFFVATFEAEEEDQFDEVLFGVDSANFEAQEAQFALLTSAFQEANEIVQDDDDEGSDIEDFAEAFFEAVEDDEDFQETISDIEDFTEVINFGNLFNLINERSALPAVVASTVTVIEIQDADDDDLEEIEQEIAAFIPTFEFVAVGASSTNKREVSEGTILLAHAADSADERRLNDVLIQAFCIDREITCTRVRIVDEAQLDLVEQFASSSSSTEVIIKKGDKGWVDPKDDDWKPAHDPHHDPHAGDDGYGKDVKKESDESTERDSDEEDDDNAGSIAAIAVSAVLAAATMFM